MVAWLYFGRVSHRIANLPANNEHELITLQTEVLGIPPSYFLDRASRPNEFFIRTSAGYKPLRYTYRKGRRRSPGGRPLASACGSSDPQFIDFVSRCLTWDPADRMTPQEALRHPYIASKRRPTTKRSYSEDGLVAYLPSVLRNPVLTNLSMTQDSIQQMYPKRAMMPWLTPQFYDYE